MKQNAKTFDVASHLTDEATIAEYLKASAEDPTPGVIELALQNVAEAREMIRLAAVRI